MTRSQRVLPTLGVVAATLLVTAGLIVAEQPEAASVWAGLATVGAVLVLLRGRAAIWPFWAMLGLAAAVAGSYQTTEFNWISAAAGLVVALAVGAAALGGAALRSPGSESPLEIAASLARGLIGASGPKWTVRPATGTEAGTAADSGGGQLVRTGDPGPGGSLEVPMGWVVATVRENAFARLVDPSHGPVTLAPGETPFRAIPVGEQEVSGTVTDPLSRDAVRIDRVDWGLRYRLRGLPESEPQPGDAYPYDPVAVKEAAWSPAPFEAAVAAAAGDALRDAIREQAMQALFQPEGGAPPLEAALESARRRIDARLRSWGHVFLGLSVRGVQLSDDVQEHLTAVWHAKVERQVRTLHRQAEEAGRVPFVPQAPAEAEGSLPAPDDSGSKTKDSPATTDDRGAKTESRASVRAETEAEPDATEVAVDQSDGSSTEPATSNPVSFTQFLRTLRSRAADGDDRADSVLRQVMDSMDRLGPTLADVARAPDEGSGPSEGRRTAAGSETADTPPEGGSDGAGGADAAGPEDGANPEDGADESEPQTDEGSSGQQNRLL